MAVAYRQVPYRWLDLSESAAAAARTMLDVADALPERSRDRAALERCAEELAVALKEHDRQVGEQLIMPGLERWVNQRPWIVERAGRARRQMLEAFRARQEDELAEYADRIGMATDTGAWREGAR